MLARLALTALLLIAGWPALAQSGDPSFHLVNRSGQTIREVYVSASTDQYWGHDRLGSAVLPHGQALPIRLPPAVGCRQDIRVVYGDGRPEERRGVNTCAVAQVVFGTAAPAPPPSAEGPRGNPSFNLVNHGRIAMREVYVSSVREEMWGESRLPRPMQPGEHLAVRLPENDCLNDIRVIWMDGRTEDRRRVDTCQIVNMVFQ